MKNLNLEKEILGILVGELGALGIKLHDIPLPFSTTEKDGGLVWVDGEWQIHIPPHLVNIHERLAFYLHCVAHYLLLHHVRKPPQCLQDVWDSAADYVANSLWFYLQSRLGWRFPPNMKESLKFLKPYNKEWKNKSVEEVYFILLTQPRSSLWKMGDSHSSFGYKSHNLGEDDIYLRSQLVESIAQGIVGGNLPADRPLALEVKPLVPPSTLYNLLQHFGYVEDEVLDVVFLSYNKAITTPLMFPSVWILHICDVSASMRNYIQRAVCALWSIGTVAVSLFGDTCKQTVVFSDVDIQGVWEGVGFDAKFRKLLKLKGLGGTSIFKATTQAISCVQRYNIIFVYSDMELSQEDIDYFLSLRQKAASSLWVLVAPHDYNSRLGSYFHFLLPLVSFRAA